MMWELTMVGVRERSGKAGMEKSRLSVYALHHFTATVVNVLFHLRSVDVTTNHAIDKAHSVLICPVVFKSCFSYSLYRTVIAVRNGRREEVATINLNDAVFPFVHNNTDSVRCSQINCKHRHRISKGSSEQLRYSVST